MKLNSTLFNFCLLFFVIVVAPKKAKEQTAANNVKTVHAVAAKTGRL
jgi:hypothetical protein